MIAPGSLHPQRGPLVHPDRIGLAPWNLVALLIATMVTAGIASQTAARGRVAPTTALVVGAFVALLAMVGLRSLSLRLVSRSALLVSAAVMVRFGTLRGSLTAGGQALLAWLVAGVVVLVLTDRMSTALNRPLGGGSRHPPVRPGATARTAVAVSVVVLLIVLVLAPLLLPHVGGSTSAGSGPKAGAENDSQTSLRATDSLDMTRRPDLTDEVVFTVESAGATFWRGQTFDRWDGRRWTRSDPQVNRLGAGGAVRPAADDLAATGSDRLVQRFHIRAGFADVVYAAATPSTIEIDRLAGQRPDGTVISEPLGNGATYTVVSRRIPLTGQLLRSVSGGIPSEVQAQYAQEPVATDRVRAAARRVAGNARTQYDKVLALEAWMGRRTEYSLDAPLAPEGVDVVDHFLFESRQGWCEQVASSLVVLARANGIPARLVTGFVPGQRDVVTGTFTVRAKDAHSWAEVWFPKVGWVPFDPTAEVPLAGNDRPSPTAAQWLADHLVVILLGLAAVVVTAGPTWALLRRWRSRRASRPVGWAAVTDSRLARLGDRADRLRRPGETATAYADALALRYGDERLMAVGRAVDDALYAPDPPTESRRRDVDDTLDALAEATVPDAPPDVRGTTSAGEPHPVGQ